MTKKKKKKKAEEKRWLILERGGWSWWRWWWCLDEDRYGIIKVKMIRQDGWEGGGKVD